MILDGGECSRDTRGDQRMEDGKRALQKLKANFRCEKPFFMVCMHYLYVIRSRGVVSSTSLALVSRIIRQTNQNHSLSFGLKHTKLLNEKTVKEFLFKE